MAAAVPMVIGMVATAGGAVMEARAAKQEADVEESWHKYNAAVAEQEAKTRSEQAAVQSADARRQAKRIQAQQRTAYAAAGISMSGSPLEVMGETAANLERSILEVSRQGETEAQQLRSQAGISLFQAETAKLKGRNRRTAIYGNAFSGLMMQGSSFAQSRAKPKDD